MTNKSEVYKCEICGNIVEVLHEGQGELVCCGKPMVLQKEQNEEDGKTEKHRPVIDGKIVKVGSVPHPMTEEHFIEWIEVSNGDKVIKTFLEPEQEPKIDSCFEPTSVRAYCNIHGLWKS